MMAMAGFFCYMMYNAQQEKERQKEKENANPNYSELLNSNAVSNFGNLNSAHPNTNQMLHFGTESSIYPN